MKKFSIDQKEFASVLSFCQPICSKKTTMPITTYVLLQINHQELTIKATDLEISLQFTCTIFDSSITQEQFLVPGKKLFDIIKELDSPVQCELKGNQLHIVASKVKFALNIKDAQEYPTLPERIENLMQIGASALLELFSKVCFLIPQNNSNPALNGLLIEIDSEGVKMTTTDGHCLAQVTTSAYTLQEPQTWLVPRRGIFEIKKILENTHDEVVFLGLCDRQLVFSGESFNFFTKLLADNFPQYQPILQKDSFMPARLNKAAFVKTLRRSACLLSGQFLATQFTFSEQGMQVHLQNNDIGTLKEELSLQDFQGEPLQLRFYSPYLLNGLQSFTQDEVKFYLKNNTRPIIFQADDAEKGYQLTYLVMPVSTQNNA